MGAAIFPPPLDAARPIPYLSTRFSSQEARMTASPVEGEPLIRPSSTEHPLYEKVVEACRTVYDPEIPVNIYDLGLVYTVEISDENEVNIHMSLTAPGCPVAGEMPGWVADAVEPIDGVKQVDVHLVWEPPWGMDMMSDEARLELGFM
jgi:FeS assembly SUF system protein